MKKSLIKLLFTGIILIVSLQLFSQKEVGVWRTVDDDTGIDKSHVEIYKRNGKLYGKIVKILDTSEGENPLCTECSGALKNKPILGMQIINGLEKRRRDWYLDNGILDPENGRTYNCKIWLKDDNTLYVRGYVGFFYRTQEWYRVK